MRILVIKENDANQRVDKFLSKALPNLPKNLMYKYIRNKKIKVNKKRCSISQRLAVNDEVMCYIAEEFFEVKKDDRFLKAKCDLRIIYEDENIIIMNKEAGLLAHNDEANTTCDTLVNRMKYYLYRKGEYEYENEQSFVPALCHRIDRNTSGIVIGAKNAQALRDMNTAIKEKAVKKQYLCICEGIWENKQQIIKAYHKKENKKVSISLKEKSGYKEILTGYRVLLEKKGLSLLEVDLLSGKSHQIRALMGYLKHPLYGDTRYGAKPSLYAYQALCAYRVTFENMPESLSYLNQKVYEIKDVDFVDIMK